MLTEKVLLDIAKEYGNKSKTINKSALKLLEERTWTGNIRELRNVIERLVILGSEEISAEDVNRYAI